MVILAVLLGVSQGLGSLARLSSKAKELELKEEELFDHHLNTKECPQPVDNGQAFSECEIQVGGRTTRVIKFEQGFTLVELTISLLILSLLLALSYPATRQLLKTRRHHLELREERLSLANTTREIKHRLAAAALLPLQGNLVDVSDSSFWQQLLPRSSSPSSPLLLSLEPLVSRPLKTTGYSQWQADRRINSLSVNGNVPKSKKLLLGICANNWVLVKLIDQVGATIRLETLTPTPSAPPTTLFPLRRAEILYVDELNTLRRFRIAEGSTDPLLYNLDSLNLKREHSELTLSLSRKTISQSFSLRLQPNALLALAL